MRYVNKLAPHTSEWEFLSSCSTYTKMDRDNFVRKCSLLERLCSKLAIPLDEFYFNSFEDEVYLNMRIRIDQTNEFKPMIPLLKKFINKHFPLRNTKFFDEIIEANYGDGIGSTDDSSIRIYKDLMICIDLKLDCGDPMFNFPSPIYLDACVNYA